MPGEALSGCSRDFQIAVPFRSPRQRERPVEGEDLVADGVELFS